ncbi:hypothetical protein HC928_23925 [bacterium]|nr:hypothetical protein [bacterium]
MPVVLWGDVLRRSLTLFLIIDFTKFGCGIEQSDRSTPHNCAETAIAPFCLV